MENRSEFREQPNKHETFLLTQNKWPEIKDRFIVLVVDCFPDMSPLEVEQLFTRTFKNDVVVLLNDESRKKIVGFTQAHIYTGHPELANIGMTGIASDTRGKGLVGELMIRLEDELRKKGVQYITRQARIADGYADTIERHYGDRIVEKKDPEGKMINPTRHFKIKL